MYFELINIEMEKHCSTLGEAFKYVRKEESLTQAELEKRIGLSSKSISNIENGKVESTKEENLNLIRDKVGYEIAVLEDGFSVRFVGVTTSSNKEVKDEPVSVFCPILPWTIHVLIALDKLETKGVVKRVGKESEYFGDLSEIRNKVEAKLGKRFKDEVERLASYSEDHFTWSMKQGCPDDSREMLESQAADVGILFAHPSEKLLMPEHVCLAEYSQDISSDLICGRTNRYYRIYPYGLYNTSPQEEMMDKALDTGEDIFEVLKKTHRAAKRNIFREKWERKSSKIKTIERSYFYAIEPYATFLIEDMRRSIGLENSVVNSIPTKDSSLKLMKYGRFKDCNLFLMASKKSLKNPKKMERVKALLDMMILGTHITQSESLGYLEKFRLNVPGFREVWIDRLFRDTDYFNRIKIGGNWKPFSISQPLRI